MKKVGCIFVALLCSLVGLAQEENTLDMTEDLDDMDQFLEEAIRDFDNFMEEADKEFVKFLSDPWKELDAERPLTVREKPEPAEAPVCNAGDHPQDEESRCLDIREVQNLTTTEGAQDVRTQVNDADDLSFGTPTETAGAHRQKKETIVSLRREESELEAKLEQQILEEIAEEEGLLAPGTTPLYAGGKDRVEIIFSGQKFYLNGNLQGVCQLKDLRESSVASAYSKLCRKVKSKRRLLTDCRQIADDLQLNDWGVFWLVETVADAFCNTKNESVVMQQFLLNELGYKSKMARKSGEEEMMMLFVATDCTLYALPYFKLNGLCYYNITDDKPGRFSICERSSAKARNSIHMRLENAPELPGERVRSMRQTANGQVAASVIVPQKLMEFYRQFPSCDYSVYVTAPVNEELENMLLASLKPAIEGKSEVEAANILLNYIHTAFKYATDDEQFGYEKPFFVEEVFYYPACDCEDRAIFYSYLVRKLLKLDVVLLDYPDHIATAVCFNENARGDYFMIEGRKYVVCDPTYIGASIGMSMPCYKNTPAGILKF